MIGVCELCDHEDQLCPDCYTCKRCCICDDYDADELGKDPEEEYDA